MKTSESGGDVTIFLGGDVMTGRGLDQILSRPVEPELREPAVRDARDYVKLAEAASGPVPAPVPDRDVWGEGLDILEAHAPDARIVNLETSITGRGTFWPGKAVHYRMHPANTGCLRAAQIDVCSLANNHVLDFGAEGLVDTLAALREAGIEPAGAGRDIGEARRAAEIILGAKTRILVAAMGSTTSGIPPSWRAGSSSPGVDLLPDLSEASARAVGERFARRRQPGDIAVLSLHWGSNWGYDVPEEMKRFARALVDAGVDVVHGHSSHHPRAIEVYRRKLILYGAGDLITDYEGISGYEEFRGDLGAMYFPTISLCDGSLRRLRIVPVQMRGMRLRAPSRRDGAWLLDTLRRISAPLGSHFSADSDGAFVLDEGGARGAGPPARER